MPRATTLTALAELAEEQWGMFTSKQVASAGIAWTTLARLARAGGADRIAHGVYRLRGSPPSDHLELRAAWLQLAPDTPVWERAPSQGVVSHRSAAAVYGLGHLPADTHQFILPARRQSRRVDVRLYRAHVEDGEWINLTGLPVTRPARTVADLLGDREDPEAVAQVIADAIRDVPEYPGNVARAVEPYAVRFGLAKGNGLALLEWLLDLVVDPDRESWLYEARRSLERDSRATGYDRPAG